MMVRAVVLEFGAMQEDDVTPKNTVGLMSVMQNVGGESEGLNI